MLCAQQLVRDFAERLRLRIAVQFVRATIPISDAVLCVEYENRVLGEIQQARLFRQLLFPAPVFGNIDNCRLIKARSVLHRGNHRPTVKLDDEDFAVSILQVQFGFDATV